MSKVSRFLAVAAGCTALFVAVGCGSSDDSSSTASGDGSLSGKKVIVVSCASSNAVCSTENRILKEGFEEKGATVEVYENEFDPAKQTSDMNQAIAAQPDLIILQAAAGSAPVAPSLLKADAAGVPVMNIDGRVDPSAEDAIAIQVLSPHEELGKMAAENLVEGMEKAGNDTGNVIAITGTKGSLITEDRMKGFDEYMAKHPQYKVVAVEDGNWDPVKSGQLARQLFAKYESQGGIQGAYGMADYMAVPIAEAAKQSGIKIGPEGKGLIVTGSNCSAVGIKAMQDGLLYGNATQDPPTIAREALTWGEKFIQGEDTPAIVYAPVDRITPDNLDKFVNVCSWE